MAMLLFSKHGNDVQLQKKVTAEGCYNMLTLTFAVEGGERGHYGGHFGGQTVLAAANGTRLVIGEKLPASKMSVNPGMKLYLYHVLHGNDPRLIDLRKLLTYN